VSNTCISEFPTLAVLAPMQAKLPEARTLGLHNSESSKGQIINMNLLQATKVYFISM